MGNHAYITFIIDLLGCLITPITLGAGADTIGFPSTTRPWGHAPYLAPSRELYGLLLKGLSDRP